jgi:signal transduction histidine kinase
MLERLATIDRQVTRIADLVDRLLDVSTIMTSGVSLEREWVDLEALVESVLDRQADELARAGCEVELIERGPLSGLWDRARLAQVVSQLISNAQKFGPGQPIEIALEGSAGEVRLSVRDHGIGIAEEHQARIFQPFERAVTARHYGGFGLGLWFAHRIVEAHGGAITIESRPGEGARFTVALPRAS